MRLRELAIYAKVWVSRSMSWVSMVNSGMILFLVLSKLQDYGIRISIKQWYVPIYFVVILLLMFAGYLEDRLGFFREETRIRQTRNPYMKEIVERLDRIEEKLDGK